MDTGRTPRCAFCELPVEERACENRTGKGARGCPTLAARELVERARQEYRGEAIGEFARQASLQEAECYIRREPGRGPPQAVKPRLQETCEFARRLGCRRLGLAFCSGLKREARTVAEILESQGFEIVSALCKAGSVPKEELGVTEEQKVNIGRYEPMCNPVLQALLLNEAGTELNVVLGLCVGHDSLFFKYSQAPATVLAAKDRVTGHNPLAAIYTAESYYRRLRRREGRE